MCAVEGQGQEPRKRGPARPTRAFLATVLLLGLGLGLVPLPGGLARSLLQSAQSLELNKIDREATAASYYEGLINVGGDSTRSELALRLLGKPTHGMDFNDIGATHYLQGDPLQFELHPNVHRRAFGQEFSTNAHGQRDREYTLEKPPGTFRIALFGRLDRHGLGRQHARDV